MGYAYIMVSILQSGIALLAFDLITRLNGIRRRLFSHYPFGIIGNRSVLIGTQPHNSSFACILPFVELNINATGTTSPCCNFARLIGAADGHLSVYSHSLESIWNSSDLRGIRKKMHSGRKVPECRLCFEQEVAHGFSFRTQNNDAWNRENRESLSEIMILSSKDGYRMDDGPKRLLLKVGTLCNLKCRMCDGNSSSAIERDPVQSKWTPTHVQTPCWVGDSMIIGPESYIGIYIFGDLEFLPSCAEGPTRSSAVTVIQKAATIQSSLPQEASLLAVDFRAESRTSHFKIYLDGFLMVEDAVGAETNQWLVPITQQIRLNDSIQIFIATDEPLIIDRVAFKRDMTTSNKFLGQNIPSGFSWHSDKDFIDNQLFSSPSLRHVNLMGGEPTLIKDVRIMLKSLIKSGKAVKIKLSIVTNATRCDSEWMKLLAKFKRVSVVLSIDGYGDLNEYIRYGARWSDILSTIRSYKKLANVDLYCHMTLQSYNMMHVKELAQFCRAESIAFRYYMLEHPEMLSILAMPREARDSASAKLSRYISRNKFTCFASASTRTALMSIRAALDSPLEHTNPQIIEAFKKYTAELDRDRNQEFELVNAELAGFLRG
jgi:glutamate-1-semialdehyde 2,1-aminomutase